MARIPATEAGSVPVSIYALTDPRDGRTRYVGKTVKLLSDRLRIHIAAARRNEHRRVCRWIRSLLSAGTEPAIHLVRSVESFEDWQEAEMACIADHRQRGCDLTNLTNGGEGWHGLRHTDESKRKIGNAHRGKAVSAATRDKLSAAAAGRVTSLEVRSKISAAGLGRTHSPETRAKISAAKKGTGSMPGSLNPRAKLTEQDVRYIRLSSDTHASLGRRFGVSEVTVHDIRARKLWKSVA
jgi:hypothetical protein